MFSGEGTLSVGVKITAAGTLTTNDSLGLPIERTYKITASPVGDDGIYHYKFLNPDGRVVASRAGNDLSDALLGFAVEIERVGPGDES